MFPFQKEKERQNISEFWPSISILQKDPSVLMTPMWADCQNIIIYAAVLSFLSYFLKDPDEDICSSGLGHWVN